MMISENLAKQKSVAKTRASQEAARVQTRELCIEAVKSSRMKEAFVSS